MNNKLKLNLFATFLNVTHRLGLTANTTRCKANFLKIQDFVQAVRSQIT